MKKSLLPLSLLPLLLLSCHGPAAIVKIEPASTVNTFYNHGSLVKQFKNENVEIYAQFIDFNKEDLLFHVSINNLGDDTIEINPVDFSLYSENSKLSSYDPESHLLKNQLKASKKEQNHKTLSIIDGVADVATVTAGAVATFSGYSVSLDSDRDYVQGPIPYFNNAPEVEFWKNDVMRRTTLFPGTQVDGLVVFPRDDDMRAFKLALPLSNQLVQFDFKQRLFKAR